MLASLPETEAITCLVVADHQLCGQAVGGLLSELCGLELVAVCGSVAEARRLMQQASPPGLLLLDGYQAEGSWEDVGSVLKHLHPDGRLILLTGGRNDLKPPREIAPVLLGVVEKERPWQELIDVVSRWQQQHPSAAVRRNLSALEQLQRLSPREWRVFQCLGKGMQNKEIARILKLRVNTVETYRKIISAKLGLSGVELVRAAALHRCIQVTAERTART